MIRISDFKSYSEMILTIAKDVLAATDILLHQIEGSACHVYGGGVAVGL